MTLSLQKSSRLRAALLALALPLLIAGCASTTNGERVQLAVPFDQDEALTQLRDGSNTIDGVGLMLHPFGGASTCAGQQVTLVPATAHADERMAALYGPARQGRIWPPGPRFEPDLLAYQAAARHTTCGPNGEFRFDRVADGTFYVATIIPWRPRPGEMQLASLAQRVTIQGGKVFKIEIKERP